MSHNNVTTSCFKKLSPLRYVPLREHFTGCCCFVLSFSYRLRCISPNLPNVFPYRIPMLMPGDLMRPVLYQGVPFSLFSFSIRPDVFYLEERGCTELPASRLCLVLAACSSALDSLPLVKQLF